MATKPAPDPDRIDPQSPSEMPPLTPDPREPEPDEIEPLMPDSIDPDPDLSEVPMS
jgi:hypothetical protein